MRSLRRTILASDWAKVLVAAAFLAVFGGVAVGAGAFFLRAFRYVLVEPIVGPVITRYLLEASFAAVFALGAASFVVSSPALLFGGPESRFLAAMPVEPSTAFFHRFIGAVIVSSWPVLFLGIPALWALGVAGAAPLPYYVFALATLGLFALAIGAVGGILSFALWAVFGKLPAGARIVLGTGLGVLLTALLARTIVPRGLFALFTAADASEAGAAITGIRERFFWWPSHSFVEAISGAIPGTADGTAAIALGLASAAIIAVFVILAVLAQRAYLPLWRMRQERGLLARPADVRGRAKLRRPFPRFLKWRHSFLFEKDLLVLARSPEELARAGFLLALLVFYVFAARSLTFLDALRTPELFSTIIAFAYAAIGYFALTFGLRFVFPAFSLEGRSAWILWSSPLHLHEIFSWKFFFWSTLIGCVLETVAVLTAWLFALPALLAVYLIFAVLCAVVPMIAIALVLGTIFPNFRDRDPDSLSTSPAGLLTAASGLIVIAVLAEYLKRFAVAYLATGTIDIVGAFGMLIVAAAIAGIGWAVAPRYMDQAEFPS